MELSSWFHGKGCPNWKWYSVLKVIPRFSRDNGDKTRPIYPENREYRFKYKITFRPFHTWNGINNTPNYCEVGGGEQHLRWTDDFRFLTFRIPVLFWSVALNFKTGQVNTHFARFKSPRLTSCFWPQSKGPKSGLERKAGSDRDCKNKIKSSRSWAFKENPWIRVSFAGWLLPPEA